MNERFEPTETQFTTEADEASTDAQAQPEMPVDEGDPGALPEGVQTLLASWAARPAEWLPSIDAMARTYTCDHFGMAEFFTSRHGEQVRWNEDLQAFMVHLPDQGRWRQDGRSHEQVTRLVRRLSIAVNQAADAEITAQDVIDAAGGEGVTPEQQKAAKRKMANLRRWYNVFSGTGNMSGVVRAVQPTVTPCRATDFNQHSHLLNLPNGTYDVTRGVLRDHDQADLLAHQVTVPLDLNLAERPLSEVAPHFDQLLTRMCAAPGEVSDEVAGSRRMAVCAWLAYNLHGSNPEKRLAVFQGASQIGKNQVMEVIGTLLGDELAWQAARPQLLIKARGDRHDADEAKLAGTRLVMVNELTSKQVLDESQVLRFVNPEGTMVGLRRMRQDRVDVPVTWKITVPTNELPKADLTPQMVNRLLILQLSRVEVPASERYDVKRAILQTESAAVLAHLVTWWREWYLRWVEPGSETGLIITEEARQALAGYQTDNKSPAEQFIEERLVLDPDGSVKSTEVWEHCDAYYRTQHGDVDKKFLGGRRTLYKLLSETLGVTRVERDRGSQQTRLLTGFQGIRLLDPQELLSLLSARGEGQEY